MIIKYILRVLKRIGTYSRGRSGPRRSHPFKSIDTYYRDGYYTDIYGYHRNRLTQTLIHREIAYHEIYLKHREKYTLPFSSYQVHHINGKKTDNRPENLMIVTEAHHRKLHGLRYFDSSMSPP